MEVTTVVPDPAATQPPLLREGETCWRVERARQVGLAIDAAAYFRAFREACEQAQRSIFVLGWDFDRRERLGRHRGAPRLGNFLRQLVRENPRVHIYLLVWDFNMVYAAERELFQAWRLRGHARLHVAMDGRHPAGASQHQKLVVIDDTFAFCGGIDLSRWRWDTSEHLADDPRRADPDGKPYPPFHDLMVALDGEAARALGELARQRWADSGSGIEPVPASPASQPVWPASLELWFSDQQVGIARTFPAYAGREEVREVESLYLASVAAARHSIYIENQYFTARRLARALAQRLDEEDGPEVIVVLLATAAAWRWTPLQEWLDAERIAAALQWFENPLLRALAVIVGIVAASLLMVPLTVLVIAAALLLGVWEGFGLALAGALTSAMLAIVLGQTLSSDHLMQLTCSRVERLSKRIAKRGVMAMIILRLMPVAPFTVVNLIAGASHVSLAQFVLGSALGLAPGIFAITLFSDSLYQAVTDPGPVSLGVLALVVALLIGGTVGLRRMLRSSR